MKTKINWTTLRFEDFDPDTFHDVLKLRIDVFVVEQDCPYEELDGKDRGALHIIGREDAGRVIAYARILPPTDSSPPAIGRVVIDENHRRQGIGHQLMEICIQKSHDFHGTTESILSAQDHLREFYSAHGYKAMSGIYDLDGIPHVDMVRGRANAKG